MSRLCCKTDTGPSRSSRAFTLIELLVVIAIIALLIGLLLPSLGKARKSARLVVSLANIRTIAQAGGVYQQDQKGLLPLMCTYRNRMGPAGPGEPPGALIGWCTWSAWGKTTHTSWAGALFGGGFDIRAENRPLNQYLYPNLVGKPNANAGIPAQSNASERTNLAMPAFHDPSDSIGHQQDWPAANSPSSYANNGQIVSCYDDVGTSYQWQAKWWEQVTRTVSGTFEEQFEIGARRFKIADSFSPSRMVWINDEWADITINQGSANARVKNGYDDINKSVMAFMDAHASYLTIYPGGSTPSDGNWNDVYQYNNEKYTVIFPFVR